MQCPVEFQFCQLCFFDIIAIGFVDHDSIGHFHNATFNALQFIAGTGNF